MKFEIRQNVDELRSAMIARIDADTEKVRGHFITLGAGQSMVYAQKRAEAEAWAANPDLPPSEIPHLYAEAQVFGVEVIDVVAEVLTLAEQWKSVSAVIESRRLEAKERLRNAQTVADLRAAAFIDWTDILALRRI
jgi:hypothetical protein